MVRGNIILLRVIIQKYAKNVVIPVSPVKHIQKNVSAAPMNTHSSKKNFSASLIVQVAQHGVALTFALLVKPTAEPVRILPLSALLAQKGTGNLFWMLKNA